VHSPYIVVGGFALLTTGAEINDMLAYLRLLVNPADASACCGC